MLEPELLTLRAAVRVKLGLDVTPLDIQALSRGMPQHRCVELGLSHAADFILRRFATDDGETQILRRLPAPGAGDVLREDEP